jgi:hypothetical protein
VLTLLFLLRGWSLEVFTVKKIIVVSVWLLGKYDMHLVSNS